MYKPLFEVRQSPIQGFGAFATQRIRKGARVIEYLGERISAEEGDRRYSDEAEHPHVLLFVVDDDTVIDAGVNGNEARFINHSCEPNCKSVTIRKRVYIEAIKNIKVGEELGYDYESDYFDAYIKPKGCKCVTCAPSLHTKSLMR